MSTISSLNAHSYPSLTQSEETAHHSTPSPNTSSTSQPPFRQSKAEVLISERAMAFSKLSQDELRAMLEQADRVTRQRPDISESGQKIDVPQVDEAELAQAFEKALTEQREFYVDEAETYQKLANIQFQMEQHYDTFIETLSKLDPKLSEKDFGFSVGSDGSLIITNPDATLTVTEKQRLTALINKSDGLRASANTYAKTVIDFVGKQQHTQTHHKHHSPTEFTETTTTTYRGVGRINLTLENFGTSLDLAQALTVKQFTTANTASLKPDYWMNQLMQYGERRIAP